MTQATLDVRPPDLATARATGECAAHLATERAERCTPNFSARAEAAILAKLATGRASGEDLTDHAAACGIEFKDGRALGSVFASLLRRDLIVVVGECKRRRGHGSRGGSIYALANTYEAHKAAFLAAHPGATAEQVESACQDIAERLGA